MIKLSEKEHQQRVVRYCRANNIFVMGSGSGMYLKDWNTISLMKSLAIISDRGTPDLFIPIVRRNKESNYIEYAGLFIELKKDNGKPSEDQAKVIKYLEGQGYLARIIKGSENAINLIIDYVNGNSLEQEKYEKS